MISVALLCLLYCRSEFFALFINNFVVCQTMSELSSNELSGMSSGASLFGRVRTRYPGRACSCLVLTSLSLPAIPTRNCLSPIAAGL